MADCDYTPNTMFKIEPLNTNNWLGWKQHMMALFQDRDLDRYVDGMIPRPAQVGTTVDLIIAAEQLAWDEKDKSAQNCIRLTVGDANMAHILGASTVKQMWDQLKAVRERKGNQGILAAQRKLYQTVAEEGVDVAQHIANFRLIQDELL